LSLENDSEEGSVWLKSIAFRFASFVSFFSARESFKYKLRLVNDASFIVVLITKYVAFV